MNQLGKRYKCQTCGTEVLCTKAGEGAIYCCDKEMETQEPRPLPSSDQYFYSEPYILQAIPFI